MAHLDQVLDGRAEVATNGNLLERNHQVAARLLAVLAPREHVAELRVGKLVQATAGADTVYWYDKYEV